LWWPLQDAVGDRLAAYLANHGAGPWLRSRSDSPSGYAGERRTGRYSRLSKNTITQ
jgi:hypothetical protein